LNLIIEIAFEHTINGINLNQNCGSFIFYNDRVSKEERINNDYKHYHLGIKTFNYKLNWWPLKTYEIAKKN
jgi:hypothetical protein